MPCIISYASAAPPAHTAIYENAPINKKKQNNAADADNRHALDMLIQEENRKQNEDFIRRQILESEPLIIPQAAPLKKPNAAAVPAPSFRSAPPPPAAKPQPNPATLHSSDPAEYETPKEEMQEKKPANLNPRAEKPDIAPPIPVPTPKSAIIPEAVPQNPQQSDMPSLFDETPPNAAPKTPNMPDIAVPYTRPPSFFPRFGDRRPHIWTNRRKPWHYPIHGADVSWHNKSLDWAQMARSRVSFVFIKATEGGDHIDPAFKENWRAAKAAGIPRGAYHFYYFCRPAKDQLRWFLQNVPRDKTALPPVLDMEWNHASTTCRRRPSPAEIYREMRLFLHGLEKYYGKRPLIYTTVDFFHDNTLGHIFKAYPFWLRSVADHPDERYKKHPWLFWQYTGTGRIPGIDGDADISVFSGNSRQWQNWLRKAMR